MCNVTKFCSLDIKKLSVKYNEYIMYNNIMKYNTWQKDVYLLYFTFKLFPFTQIHTSCEILQKKKTNGSDMFLITDTKWRHCVCFATAAGHFKDAAWNESNFKTLKPLEFSCRRSWIWPKCQHLMWTEKSSELWARRREATRTTCRTRTLWCDSRTGSINGSGSVLRLKFWSSSRTSWPTSPSTSTCSR